jgi:hypothetical protein
MGWGRFVVLFLGLACGTDTPQGAPGGTEASTSGAGDSEAQTSELPTSDTGAETSWDAPPSCAEIDLPGDPDDVAATPRADRDAEILALGLDPELFVAPQDRYEVIVADLTAIRALRPELTGVHVECVVPYGYAFWSSDDYGLVDAVWLGEYHAWDCHNAFYGVEHRAVGEGGDVWRIDGFAFAIRVDGVFSPAFAEVYATIPGLEAAGIAPFWAPNDGFASECDTTGASLRLDATFDDAGVLDERTYTFETPELGTIAFLVAPGEAPMQLE